MLYYRAKLQTYDDVTGWPLISGELVTIREREERFPTVPSSCFELVNYPKNKVTYVFGIRKPTNKAEIMVED